MAILITFILSIFTKNNIKRAGHDKWNLIKKKYMYLVYLVRFPSIHFSYSVHDINIENFER